MCLINQTLNPDEGCMDVSLYNFLSQKALHQGLQQARSYGHKFLEVEHIALAMLRAESIVLDGDMSHRLQEHLQQHLSKFSKVFGNIKIEFGHRLDKSLDEAEAKMGDELVDEMLLWKCFINNSKVLKKFFTIDPNLNPADEVNDKPSKKAVSSTPNKTNPKEHKPPKNLDKEKDKHPTPEKSQTAETFQIPDKLAEVLDKFTVDLSSMAERGELDPVIGRDLETRRVLEILGRKKKNNPILIGEAGVGKTAVAEFLALRIAEGRVPETIRGKRVLSLDLGGLVAGAKFRGEFEERMKNLLKAIHACRGAIILFIDEIHLLVGAGRAEGSADAANLLKPALARGELRCLGATTLDEFRTYIEKDPALERRFQSVMVEEPSRDSALAILRGVKSRYEIYHGVQIHDEALVQAVDFSIRFLPHRRLPDKAIDLLDEACSRLRMQIDSMPSVMDDLRSKIEQFNIEKNALNKTDKSASSALVKIEHQLKNLEAEYKKLEAIWHLHKNLLEKMRKLESRKAELESLYENTKQKGDFEFAAKLQHEEIPRIITEITLINQELTSTQGQFPWLRQVVGGIEIAEVISMWTRVPVQKVFKDEAESLLNMEQRIGQRVFGQTEALSKLSKAIRRSRVGINDPKRPLGVFLFIGPTGVGKTETAKALAEEIFDDENRMVRIDMSEYMEQHNISRLIGSPPGYIGHGEGGELTEAVRRTPYTVVLFDEIEKAHPRVLDILLQTFDDGRLTDGNGRVIDFKNTIMIMTSNIGISSTTLDMNSDRDDHMRRELALVLRPEFVGRIEDIIVFKPLAKTHVEHLLQRKMVELNQQLQSRQFRVLIGTLLEKEIIDHSIHAPSGGRALRQNFQNQVIDQIAERLLRNPELCKGVWQIEKSAVGTFSWNEDFSLDRYLKAAG